MVTRDRDNSQGSPASQHDQVRKYLRHRLNKLSAHIKEKLVDSGRLIQAEREEFPS